MLILTCSTKIMDIYWVLIGYFEVDEHLLFRFSNKIRRFSVLTTFVLHMIWINLNCFSGKSIMMIDDFRNEIQIMRFCRFRFSISMNQFWISNGENRISALDLIHFDQIWSIKYFSVALKTKMVILGKFEGFCRPDG